MTKKPILQKAFFGKDTCLKITLSNNKECFMEFGKPSTDKTNGWRWKPVKFNDIELGEILLVLEKEKEQTSFFHTFKDEKTQIWISRKGSYTTFKVKEASKGLNDGERVAMREIIKHCIVRMNITI
ncbi:MAG: hypothetical protein ACOCU6_00080 [Nanoarchaeota archaeon]